MGSSCAPHTLSKLFKNHAQKVWTGQDKVYYVLFSLWPVYLVCIVGEVISTVLRQLLGEEMKEAININSNSHTNVVKGQHHAVSFPDHTVSFPDTPQGQHHAVSFPDPPNTACTQHNSLHVFAPPTLHSVYSCPVIYTCRPF